MLIKLDILSSKEIVINYKRELLYINNCQGIQVSIKVTLVKNKVKKAIKSSNKTIIFAQSTTIISIRLREKKLFKNRNLLFISIEDSKRFENNNEILLHIIDVNLCAIQVNNISSKTITISKNCRLDFVYKYKKESCYIASSKYDYLAIKSFLKFDL